MGVLTDMVNKFAGKATDPTANQTSGLGVAILQMLNNQPGGLAGLVQSFHEKGVGDIVSSWVSTDQNLPISAQQIQTALGSEQVKQFAAEVGISPDVASSKLAESLPAVVDTLTPDGKIPETANLLRQGLGFLTQKL